MIYQGAHWGVEASRDDATLVMILQPMSTCGAPAKAKATERDQDITVSVLRTLLRTPQSKEGTLKTVDLRLELEMVRCFPPQARRGSWPSEHRLDHHDFYPFPILSGDMQRKKTARKELVFVGSGGHRIMTVQRKTSSHFAFSLEATKAGVDPA